MTESTKPRHESPLGRWSRLKREVAGGKDASAEKSAERLATPPPAGDVAPAAPPPASASRVAPDATPGQSDPLPPVESLTIDSDFSAFLKPKVDDALKRQALKQLFRDPHFNVMDGLDVYVGDYSQPDPISPDIVRQMVQGRYIFDPPPTRINAQGFVEDVPAEELAALQDEPPPPTLDCPAEPNAEATAASPLPMPDEGEAAKAIGATGERGAEAPPTEAPDGAHPRAR